MSGASTYAGWKPSPPEPPGNGPNELILFRSNAHRNDELFGYQCFVQAGNIADVAKAAFPAMRMGLRELGYDVGTNMRLVFVCQLGFERNINLSGYCESAESELVFMRFVAELNRFHFFLKSFEMDFVLLEPPGR